MKIFSWNVNGIRAVHRKGAWAEFLALEPDIVGLQETKAHPEQLTQDLLEPLGYKSYFSSCKIKKGYSGVAIYTKTEPLNVEYGMGIERFDQEGRIITTYYEDFVLLNVYFPNGGGGPVRLAYKMDFYEAFLKHVKELRADGHKVIFCGDVNTAHTEIDLARPKANEKNTGFLPQERSWMDEVVTAEFTDTFRYYNPDKVDQYSYWDMKTRARDRNVGWRIDYFFVAPEVLPHLKKAEIHQSVLGSDHCPISIDLSF